MSQEVVKIKKRIKSVTGAYKVTSAMQLVSTVKLKKWKNKMLSNRTYTTRIDEITSEILRCSEGINSPFTSVNTNSKKKLFVIVSSTLGLCGSYNNNIFKLADANITNIDDAIILGNKGIVHYENGEFTHINDFNDYSSIQDASIIKQITDYITKKFLDGTYASIHMIYSKYKNSLVFTPSDYQILPLNKLEDSSLGYPPIMEPNPETLLNTLIPIYLKTTIYAKLLESEVCEQAARSNAMENATNNATDLLNNLQIEFNKARQGAITQEIIEIVAAAESL